MPPPAPRALVLNASFNHDRSCLAVATTRGFQIIRLDTGELAYEDALGAVRVAEMLWSTSLVAVVGAGDDPRALSPRTLRVLNTSAADRRPIADLSFRDAVLAVRLNRARLVVVTERRAIVHDAATLASLRAVETAQNPRGAVALAEDERVSLLALPSPAAPGVVLLIDAHNLTVADEIRAHDAPVAALALTPDAAYLATASVKGTVVRVHRVAAAAGFGTHNDAAAFESNGLSASSSSSSSSPGISSLTFRRGVRSEAIKTLAFGPPRALGLRTDGVAREARAGPLLLLAAGAEAPRTSTSSGRRKTGFESGGGGGGEVDFDFDAGGFEPRSSERRRLPAVPEPAAAAAVLRGFGHALARAGSSLGAGLARRVARRHRDGVGGGDGRVRRDGARKAADAVRDARRRAREAPRPSVRTRRPTRRRGGFGVAGVAQLLDARTTGFPGRRRRRGRRRSVVGRSRGGAFVSSCAAGLIGGVRVQDFRRQRGRAGVRVRRGGVRRDGRGYRASSRSRRRARGAERGRREGGGGGGFGAGEGDENARSDAPSSRWLEGEEVDGGEGGGRGAMAASISAGMAGSVFAESFPR